MQDGDEDPGAILARFCRPFLDEPSLSWVRDFVLAGPTAAADVAILTDARPQAHALLLSATMSGVEESGALRGVADGSVAVDYFVIPALSSPSHSAGLVVQRMVRDDGNVEFGIGRHVVCNATGGMLVFWTETLHKETPNRRGAPTAEQMYGGLATLIHGRPPRLPPPLPHPRRTIRIQYLGPRSKSRTAAAAAAAGHGVLRRDVHDMHAVCDANLFTAGHYDDCILMSHHALQERYECEHCFARADAHCACATALAVPQSATDWRAQVGNLRAHVGRYRGRTEVNLGVPGASPRMVRFFKAVTCDVNVISDPVIADSMRQIALQCRMRNSNPWAACVALPARPALPPPPSGALSRPTAIAIAPRPASGADDAPAYVDEAREERLRERREKNRLAAARSNARRKGKNDERRSELSAVRARVAELGATEARLRAKNRELWRQCEERGLMPPGRRQ
jgi:hypothetical protein